MDSFQPEDLIGLVATSSFFIALVSIVFIVSICNAIKSVRINKRNSDLANKLADRGFSAQEIRDILMASSQGKVDHSKANQYVQPNNAQLKSVPPQKPIVRA